MTFKRGDTVYGGLGQLARYIGPLINGGHAVEAIVGEDYHGSPYLELTHFHEVFAEPPAPRYSDEIAELHKELTALQERVDALRAEERSFADRLKKRRDTMARHEKLARLEDFIEGRITHLFIASYDGYKVLPFADAMTEQSDSRWNKPELKLLTLFGRTNGDLAWGINRYSDGSGPSMECVPFTSEADAIDEARRRIKAAFDSFNPERPWEVANAERDSVKFDVEVPSQIAQALLAMRVATLEREVADQQARLNASQAKLRELTPQVPA